MKYMKNEPIKLITVSCRKCGVNIYYKNSRVSPNQPYKKFKDKEEAIKYYKDKFDEEPIINDNKPNRNDKI